MNEMDIESATVEIRTKDGKTIALEFRDTGRRSVRGQWNVEADLVERVTAGGWIEKYPTGFKFGEVHLGGEITRAERTTAAATNPEDFQPDPDDLTRDQLAEHAHLPWSAVAETLDEWNHRAHGVSSSHHNAGLFLRLLHESGWQVVRAVLPAAPLLPPPTD